MSDNVFENFSFNYLKSINDLDDKTIQGIHDYYLAYRLGMFSRPKYIHISNEESLKFDYDYIESINDKDIDLNKWIIIVKSFGEFLFTAEKCFMYKNNGEDCCVYADMEKDDKMIITFKPDCLDTDIEISLEDTELEIMDHHSSLLDFMNDEPDPINTVLFVNIAVKRKFGKQKVSRFNMVYGSEPTLNDNTDVVLFDSIRTIVGRMIFDCFNDIINNNMMKIANNNIHINVGDVLENGIRIR